MRSTALGGEVLTRLDQSGNKKITHVPAEGLLFATQRTEGGAHVLQTYRNPLGTTETNKAVYDPLGNYIPFQAFADPRPPAGSYSSASMDALSGGLANPHAYGTGCMLDGLPTNCNLTSGMQNNGSAVQCPNNDCGPQSIRYGGIPVGWAAFNGSGYHVSDGESGAWLFFDDLQFGSLLEASKAHIASPQKKKKRRKAPVPEVMGPKYPPVTASEINLVTGGWNDPFYRISADIVAAIVDIANRQVCSDAFKKDNLKIPYDVVKAGNLKVGSLMALRQPNATERLGWTSDQVSRLRTQFNKQDNFFNREFTAEGVYVGVPTVVFNATAVPMPEFGGLRTIVTHAFIHLGGEAEDRSAKPHDLSKYGPLNEILNACKEIK